MDLQLQGKTALIVGGSRGIGKAAARELAREGVDLVLAARGLEALQATADELAKETGRRVIAAQVDTREDESVRRMVNEAVSALGHIDILVNSAAMPGGVAPVPPLAEVTDELFWEDMNTKVMGYLRCAREIAPHMRRSGWGRIINISGLAARSSGNIIGSMRNVAVAAMTKNLADDLGPDGIAVTVIHPGSVRTETTSAVWEQRASARGASLEEEERRIAENNSIRRVIDATDIAYIIAMLASPRSVAINGDTIAAGGGAGRSIYY